MSLITSGTNSNIGLVREENQDSYGRFPEDASSDTTEPGIVFAVADGMGGHRGGKEASSIAIRVLRETFFGESDDGIPDRLVRSFEAANVAVRQHGQANPECRGMGTTLTALVLHGDKAWIGHVGDSRAYRITDDGIEQLTEDHSIVAEWLRKGWLTEEQAKNHPERSLLYRALGVTTDLSVDIVEAIPVGEGVTFLLCTDGLTNHVEDAEMKEVVLSRTPQEACDHLVSLALERGGFDNVTVQAVSCTESGQTRESG